MPKSILNYTKKKTNIRLTRRILLLLQLLIFVQTTN